MLMLVVKGQLTNHSEIKVAIDFLKSEGKLIECYLKYRCTLL